MIREALLRKSIAPPGPPTRRLVAAYTAARRRMSNPLTKHDGNHSIPSRRVFFFPLQVHPSVHALTSALFPFGRFVVSSVVRAAFHTVRALKNHGSSEPPGPRTRREVSRSFLRTSIKGHMHSQQLVKERKSNKDGGNFWTQFMSTKTTSQMLSS